MKKGLQLIANPFLILEKSFEPTSRLNMKLVVDLFVSAVALPIALLLWNFNFISLFIFIFQIRFSQPRIIDFQHSIICTIFSSKIS